MNNKNNELEDENRQLMDENNKLKNENKSIKVENDKLKKENINIKNENNNLKNENTNLKNENNKLRNENNKLKNENNKLNQEKDNDYHNLNNKNNYLSSIKLENQITNSNYNYNFNKNIHDLKNKVLENQKEMRKKTENNSGNLNQNIQLINRYNINNNYIQNFDYNKNKNSKLNKLLEDMCIYGNVVKEEIRMKKYIYSNNVIEVNDALKSEKNDQGLFALGLLADNLEKNGIKTIIQSDCKGNDDADEAATSLQFISNGLIFRKKYDLHFEFGPKRNEELLNNKTEYEKFKSLLKSKISKDYNIPMDEIIVTYPQKGSFHVQIIFQSDEFNDLDLDEFKRKFKNDKEYAELCHLKEIHEDVIMSACKLSRTQLDPRGNRCIGWAVGEKRGNKEYIPPIGWTGIGLKVIDEYENNKWIGMNNGPDEWCVAYHGVGRGKQSDNVKHITGLIYKGKNFKPGMNQEHKNCNDKFHSGQKVGVGVYCTPNIKTAEGYTGVSNINGKNYKTVLMVRVNPSSIRCCDNHDWAKDYWVVSGNSDEIRPYRILYKAI